MTAISAPRRAVTFRLQRGAATLMVALVILVILTVIVLASTNVALFEQRTATNENRQRLADQVARYSLNLGGEFIKANIVKVGSLELGGWLAPSTRRWLRCVDVMDSTTKEVADLGGLDHPCMAEPDAARRAELFYYSSAATPTEATVQLPYDSLVPAAGQITSAGGTALFPATSTVRALLCRIDTTLVHDDGDPATVDEEPEPDCRLTPSTSSQNRIAVTLIASSQLTGESAASEAKETWASFSSVASSSTVPLVASGAVEGNGSVTIVTDPDGAGVGLPVSIWTRADADIAKLGTPPSAASIQTCQLGDYLNKPYREHGDPPIAESELKTTCANSNTKCGCPTPHNGGSDFLSGHVPSTTCCENVDILDVDGGLGAPNPIPDIQFFPGKDYDHLVGDAPNTPASNASALADDSLFEWVFGVANESHSNKISGETGNTKTDCGSGAQNCAIWYLTSADQLNAQEMTCAQFNAIGPEASGLYYITDSAAMAATGTGCSMPGQVGSPEAQAIVVVDDEGRLSNTIFYGMFFVRSDNKNGYFRGVGGGQSKVFGSIVVEGTTNIAGSIDIIYDPTKTSTPGKDLPQGTRLGRVSGSWLDNNRGGF